MGVEVHVGSGLRDPEVADRERLERDATSTPLDAERALEVAARHGSEQGAIPVLTPRSRFAHGCISIGAPAPAYNLW